MKCTDIHPLLTAYLDGDLDARDGSDVRGHLRECAACRQVATDEAALRDGLRALPSVEPPSSLWHGIRAQLADAEVRDSQRPAWRRALARWTPALRQIAPVTGALAAAAIAFVVWKTHSAGSDITASEPVVHTEPAPPVVVPPQPPLIDQGDVTADLARDDARRNDSYQSVADRLIAQVNVARTAWPGDKQRELDTHLGELQHAVDAAPVGHARDKALRTQIRYLEDALVREEVALR